MITVFQINLHFSRIYTTPELAEIAKKLRDFAKSHAEDFHPEIASSIDICVEDGCTKIKVNVKKAITLLVFYGGICQGAEYVWKHCKEVTKAISNEIIDDLNLQSKEILFKRTGSGDLFKLYRLMQKVKSGAITEDMAALEVAKILNKNITSGEIDDFQRVLASVSTASRSSHRTQSFVPFIPTIAPEQDSDSPLPPTKTNPRTIEFNALLGRRGVRITVSHDGKEDLVEF